MVAPAGCCEICQIAEVLADPQLQNRSNVAMTVETQTLALENLRVQVGSMYQFLGETYTVTEDGQVDVRLRARVARNVDSLDIELFLEALALRRQFLAAQK